MKLSQRVLFNRITSGMLSILLVVGTVLNPVTMLPAFATASFVKLNYENHDKNAVELYVQAEEVNYKPGDEMELTLYVQNNSEEALSGVGLSWNGDEDVFEEAEFIGYEELEAELNDKGNVVNLNLEAGEIVSLGFVGTLADDLEDLNRGEISFFYGAETESGANVTDRTNFEFTVGLFNELSMEFTDGNELALGETGTIDVKLSLNDLGYYYEAGVEEEEIVEVATDSNTEIVTASDSDAELATDSNSEEEDTEVATDSNTEDDVEVASDSDSEEEEDIEEEYVFEITDIELNMDTYGAKFKNAKVKHATVADGKAEVEATIEFEMDDDAELGEYFGTLQAAITSDKKVYNAEIGFQYEVVDELITTGFKKHGLFTAELDNFTVNVQVPKGAFDEKVELSVTELATGSEEFKTAEEAMAASEKEYDGMMALDICFINEAGEEVEPNEGYNVQVSIEMNVEVLPEDAIDTSLMVHHLAENTTDNEEKEIVVEDVADVQTLTEGTIEVKDEVFEAKFEVDNFSTYAVTWSTRNNLTTVDNVLDTKGIIRIDIADFNKRDISSFSTGGYGNRSSGWMNDWTGTGADRGVVQGIVKSDLKDDYPALNNSTSTSLKGYFDGSYGTLYSDCNYLFQKDSAGYYYYNSAYNFAHLDKTTKNFSLYNVSHYDTSSNGFKPGEHPQFLPLNDIKGPISNGSPSVYPFADNNERANYLFGMVVEFDFIMPKDGKIDGEDMIFSFSGDDDVWVFIDDKLVLDMGGVHISNTGSINFADGVVTVDKIHSSSYNGDTTKNRFTFNTTSNQWESNNIIDVFRDYSKHNLKFFYMERGEGGSNCDLRFNLQVLPQKSLTVTKELVTAEDSSTPVVEYVRNSVNYKFRVAGADVNGTSTNTSYFAGAFKSNVDTTPEFTILENGEVVGTGEVGTDGYFYLKAGQSARFENMMQYDNDNDASSVPKYVVEEIMPNTITGQYGGVGYDISGAGGTRTEGDTDTTTSGFTSYVSPDMRADLTQAVTFNNKVKTENLSALYIEKKAATGSEFTSEDIFDMKVFFKHTGNSTLEPIAVGTEYQWTHLDENKNRVTTKEKVVTAGTIKLRVGEAANMLVFADTEFVVYEDTTAGDFTPTYAAKIAGNSINPDANGHVTGKLLLGQSASITVTNELQKTSIEIPFEKILTNADGKLHEYTIKLVKVEEDNSETDIATEVVSFGEEDNGRKTVSDNFKLNFVNRDFNDITSPVTFNYKMFEVDKDSSSVDCDETVYNVAVTLTKTNGKITPTYVISKGESSNVTAVFTNTLLSSVTIRKNVTGSLGDLNKEFSFTATAAAGTFVEKNIDGECTVEKDGSSITFNLAHGEYITINKLPLGTQIVVQENYEKSANESIAYTVSVAQGGSPANGKTLTTTIKATNADIIFTNRKEAIPDTGISMDTLPYILIMLAVIGGIAFTIIRRRKEDELD